MKISKKFLGLIALVLTITGCNNYTWIDTLGTVISKNKTYQSGKPVWYLQVSYFTQSDKEKTESAPKRDTTKPRTPDEIINSLSIGEVSFGDYETVQIKVTSGVFDSFEVGNEVLLEYTRENPSEVRIKK